MRDLGQQSNTRVDDFRSGKKGAASPVTEVENTGRKGHRHWWQSSDYGKKGAS